MKLHTLGIGFVVGCATMLLVAMTLSPAPRQDPADMGMMMQEAMAKYMTPVKQHAMLAKRAGEWTADLKMWQVPGAPPEIMSGTATFNMMMDGRYLAQHYTGEYNGMPYEGAGLTGYDRIKKKYVNIWVDNMSTGIMYSEGNMNDGVITYKGEMADMMQGKYIPSKTTERDVDENTFVVSMYTPGPDGKDFMTMEITYKRIN